MQEGDYKLKQLKKEVDFSLKKVLLVEDNQMNLMLFSLLLKRLGVQITTASDGEQALKLFNKNHFDVILTDIQLPKLRGDEMARIIRQNPDSVKASTPIIALTASTLISEIEEYLGSGINQVVLKPFSNDKLKSILSELLG